MFEAVKEQHLISPQKIIDKLKGQQCLWRKIIYHLWMGLKIELLISIKYTSIETDSDRKEHR